MKKRKLAELNEEDKEESEDEEQEEDSTIKGRRRQAQQSPFDWVQLSRGLLKQEKELA